MERAALFVGVMNLIGAMCAIGSIGTWMRLESAFGCFVSVFFLAANVCSAAYHFNTYFQHRKQSQQ